MMQLFEHWWLIITENHFIEADTWIFLSKLFLRWISRIKERWNQSIKEKVNSWDRPFVASCPCLLLMPWRIDFTRIRWFNRYLLTGKFNRLKKKKRKWRDKPVIDPQSKISLAHCNHYDGKHIFHISISRWMLYFISFLYLTFIYHACVWYQIFCRSCRWMIKIRMNLVLSLSPSCSFLKHRKRSLRSNAKDDAKLERKWQIWNARVVELWRCSLSLFLFGLIAQAGRVWAWYVMARSHDLSWLFLALTMHSFFFFFLRH